MSPAAKRQAPKRPAATRPPTKPTASRSGATKRTTTKRTATKRTATNRTATKRPAATRTTTRPAAAPKAPTTDLVPVASVVPERTDPLDNSPRDPDRISDVDEWGRSEHMRALVRQVYEPIYSKWFRVTWEGLEKIPTDGGALLVANHAGAIPSDAPAIMHGIERELHRPVYGLADHVFRTLPVIGTLWSRSGGVVAHPDNAYRLLRRQHQLALVFPEGTKGPSKHVSQRYQLRRFGRGGFVEIAMRAGVPVIPLAVVGAEESMPVVARIPALSKALGIPYFPITANMALAPVLGPLATVAYFPAKFTIRVLDPVTFDVEADQPRYSRNRIMDASEAIRDTIQHALYDMLRTRRSVWFG